MIRPFALVLLCALVASARADDGIPPDTVDAVKRATVFLRVQGPNWKASGSGFIVAADKDSVLVATNFHVVSPPALDKRTRIPPAELAKALREPAVTAVFDSGTKAEQSLKAEVVAADPECDLAILRIAGAKGVAAPIDLAGAPKLSETMGIYSFGYPFGQALAVGKGNPAITVGKGSVSSLRNNDAGELALVQIDGALNPGNSGGPVVDAKGRLVGVAVSIVKNGQGIGFAVPAAEVSKMLKGRLGGVHATATVAAGGKWTVRAEVGVIDPTAAMKTVTLHYAVSDPKAKKADTREPVEKQPGAKKVTLTVAGGVASGEWTVDPVAGDIVLQAAPDGVAALGKVHAFALSVPKGATGAVVLGRPGSIPGPGAGEGVPPPAGWKEFLPADKTYIVWIPEKPKGQASRELTSTVGGFRLKTNQLLVEMTGGPVYVVEEILLPVPLAQKLKRSELIDLFRDSIADDLRGKATELGDVKMGPISGKEFRIDGDKNVIRLRVVVGLSRVFILRAAGSEAQIESDAAKTFLDSCRMTAPNPKTPDTGKMPPDVTPKTPDMGKKPIDVPPKVGGEGVKLPANRGPAIQGGGGDPEFRTLAPAGGVLVGLEIGLGRFANQDVIKSMRPVYRVGDKETFGDWTGPTSPDVVKKEVRVVAKPGYAVGVLTVKTGLGMNGLSLTFMKYADGKLDPKDAYESEWIASTSGNPVTIGDGTLVVGIRGKVRADTVSGLGLMYPGDKLFPPGKPTAVLAGGRDEELRDGAPAGGLLVGLEIGVGKWLNNDVLKAVRPVYRVGDKDSTGTQCGSQLDRVAKLVAKPGYAVGAITVKSGLGLDGLSVTFMKVVDGKLDPKDSYESEWVGGMGGGRPTKLGGDGTPVVGVVVKANAKDASGIGLLLKDEKK